MESRLAKLEQVRSSRHETHEERLERLSDRPPWTEADSVALDAKIKSEAIAEFGSLKAAAAAAREKANRTRDPMDAFLCRDLEVRAEDEEARYTHA